MIVREVRVEEKNQYNAVVTHPLQSWDWGDFREKTGVHVVRLGIYDNEKIIDGFQVTFHPVPKFSYTVGYIPKSVLPTKEVLAALKEIGRQNQAIFIKLEPNVFTTVSQGEEDPLFNDRHFLLENDCVYGKPLFTKYSFMLDLTLPEEELLKNMKQKTRYNIGLAERKSVLVKEDNSKEAFDEYLKLLFEETTKRQQFYAHNRQYHQDMWDTMHPADIAHLLKATYEQTTLATWILFLFNNVLYYPFGASSSQHRDVMASSALMWEVIRYGKAKGCKYFDMWGSLGPDASPRDPWYGFHHFKEGFGSTLMESLGTFDLVIDPPLYQIYKLADSLRWKWLRFRASLPF